MKFILLNPMKELEKVTILTIPVLRPSANGQGHPSLIKRGYGFSRRGLTGFNQINAIFST